MSDVSIALSRREGRSLSSIVSGMAVEHVLHARIGGVEENMKLIMEHLNIRKQALMADVVLKQKRASAQDSSADNGPAEKEE